jgi:hypothetical protein
MSTVAVEMTGDEAKLWRAQQKVLAQQTKIANEYKKIAKEAREAKKAAEEQAKAQKAAMEAAQRAHENAFGTRAMSALSTYAGGFTTIAAAVGVATQALREMQRAGEEAAAKKREAAGGLGMLLQMASTPAEYEQLKGKAKQLVRMGAATDENEGARMVFDIHAANAASEFDLLARAKQAGFLEDPGKAAKAAGTIQRSMGAAEAGTIGQILSKATAASRIAPGSMEQIAEASARSGATAQAMGLSDEEVMAATAMAAAASGSPEQGGTQVASLLRAFASDKDYAGLNIRESILKAKSENESFSEMTDLLGRAEAVNALNAVGSNLGEYDQLLREIHGANERNILEERMGWAAQDPAINAANLAKKMQGSEAMSREHLGTMNNLADAAAAATQEGYRRKFGDGLGTEALVAADRMSEAIVRTFAGPEFTLSQRISGPNAIDPASLGELQQAYEAAKAQAAAADKLLAAAEKLDQAAARHSGSRAPAARAQANSNAAE